MEGFGHIIGSTRFHGTYGILNLCIASHYDKGQVGIGLSDMLEQYQSVMVGQTQVGKNQMECIAGSHRFDGSAYRCYPFYIESFLFEPSLYHCSECQIVFYNQYPLHNVQFYPLLKYRYI